MLRAGIAGLALLASAAAAAQDVEDTKGFYFGGGITQTSFDEDGFSVADVDDEDNSWKVIAGYRVVPQFAVEGNYIDFGEATAPSLIPNTAGFANEAKAFALYGVGLIPVPYVDLFVKAGAAQIDAEQRGPSVGREDDVTEFAYGAGAQARFRNLALRAEYEKFDTDIIGDLDLISLSATFTIPTGR
ncbi:MAG TPA: outer membrane beta-barrel protein [Steroidobacteraceae bacterium]|nr:outer membrane beta-barrel protein [Steroidobacteraceae bacterium]